MSSSESDDDFESASEGDDESSSCDDEGISEDESDIEDQVPAVPASKVATANSNDDKIIIPSAEIAESLPAEEVLEPPVPKAEIQEKCEESSTSQPEEENKKPANALIPAINSSFSNTEISSLSESKQAKHDETAVNLTKSLKHVSISSQEHVKDEIVVSKAENSASKAPTEDALEEFSVPSDIASKISTRRVLSSRVRPPSKPKATLGAKKLGGVKLSQPVEPTSPALAQVDSEEFFSTSKAEKIFVPQAQVYTFIILTLISLE